DTTSSLPQELHDAHIDRPTRRHHNTQTRQHSTIGTTNRRSHASSIGVNKPLGHGIPDLPDTLHHTHQVSKGLRRAIVVTANSRGHHFSKKLARPIRQQHVANR